MKVGFCGLGKLGLPTALAIESKGHEVCGYDIDPNVAKYIKRKSIPYREEGAEELLQNTQIKIHDNILSVVQNSDIIFIPVQTPHDERFEGVTRLPRARADFNYKHLINATYDTIHAIEKFGEPRIVCIISTVLPGTIKTRIEPVVRRANQLHKVVKMVYTPQFIAMGTTIQDFLNPEFTLLGVDDQDAAETMDKFFTDMTGKPTFRTDIATAEGIKVFYNTFITMKTVLGNIYGEMAEKLGMNVDDIFAALSMADRRIISNKYLKSGMGDGGGCFPAGELVMTVNGMRPIETIKPGDMVLSSDGTMQRVVHRWEREYDGDLVSVSVRGMPAVSMTIEHPVLVKKDGRSRVPDGRRSTFHKIVDKLSPVKELRADSLSLDELIAWPHIGYKTEHSFSQDFIKLAGWYLSEGSAELSSRRGRLRFDIHMREESDAEDIAGWLVSCAVPNNSDRGATARVSHIIEGNSRSVRFGNMGLTRQLVSTFGKGAKDKFIPAEILWSDDNTIKSILWGLIRGDGHRGESGISYSTISQNLAWGVWIMLHRLNMKPTLRKIPARGRHQEAYEVRVRNRRLASKLCEIVGWDRYDYDKEVQVYADDGDSVWRHVQKLERKPFVGKVYNLWVEGNHTYVVGCGAVHNCHPRDNIALSWVAKQTGLSYDIFTSLMKAREAHVEWLIDVVEEQAERKKLPILLLGKTFKPETNITTGSPAILMANLMHDRGLSFAHYDPYVDSPTLEIDEPYIIFLATNHPYDLGEIPTGSVVIDPFGVTPDLPGVKVMRLGRR